jgi:hypothetical protein
MRLIGPTIFFALTVWGAWAWRRSGLRMPSFVHALSMFGLAVGAWMAWLDSTVGEFAWRRAAFELLVMPWIVYAGFFAYSGRLRRARLPQQAQDDEAAP